MRCLYVVRPGGRRTNMAGIIFKNLGFAGYYIHQKQSIIYYCSIGTNVALNLMSFFIFSFNDIENNRGFIE